MMLFLSVGLVSAWDWDNKGDYSLDNKTLTITNALGLGSVIAEITITSPLEKNYIEVGEDQIVLTFEVENLGDTYENALKEFKVLNMRTGQYEIKTFEWVFATYDNVRVDDYDYVCRDVWNDINKTNQKECKTEVIGNHIENQIVSWNSFEKAELTKGNLTVGIKTDVEQGDYYDGIPTFFGEEVTRWATWEAIVNDYIGKVIASGGADSGEWGNMINITGGATVRILSFQLSPNSASATECGAEEWGGVGYQGVLTGNNCTFATPPEFALGTSVYLWSNASGLYTHAQEADTFPIVDTNINWEGCRFKRTTFLNNLGCEVINVYSQVQAPDSPPAITINSPANTTYNSPINHTITATDDVGVSSCWFSIDDGVTNTTLVNDTATIWNYTEPSVYSDGGYRSDYYCNDTLDAVTYANVSFTQVTDNDPPDLNITIPINGTVFTTFTGLYNVSINFTASDPYLADCWYSNGTANTSVSCGTNTSLNFPSGYTHLRYYANDSFGQENSSEIVTIFVNSIIENTTYEDSVLEGDLHTFILNISADNIDELNGTFIYNGTSYTATASYTSTYGELSTDLVIPQVDVTTIFNLSWDYWINSINRATDTYNQTVNLINITVSATCSAGLNASMCWDFIIEQNLTSINASVDYNFKLGGTTNSSATTLYGSLSNIAEFCLCINSSISNNYSLGYGEIQYERTGYADRRYYMFNTTRLTQTQINNTLYLLDNADATSFLFDFKDTNLVPYTEKYSTLLRWYPDLDEYRTVEMAKTDDKGETIMRVKVEDVDYRVALYYTNGSLIQLLSPVRFACLSAPCSYSTIVESVERDYTSFFDVETSITYNSTSSFWTYTWNDPTQNTESMSFEVIRERGDSPYTICDTSASGYTGVLTCDSTGFTGTIRGIAYRTASPQTPIATKVIDTRSTPFRGVTGLFISFVILALLMLIGIFSPVASLILGIVALVPAFYLGSITLEIFIGIAVLGGIIIHFMKRTG